MFSTLRHFRALERPRVVPSLVYLGYVTYVPVLQLHLGAREVAVVPEAHLRRRVL